MHVHGGALLLERIGRAGLPGERLEWGECLCDGPVPAGLDDDRLREVRAAYLVPDAARETAARLAAQDAALAAVPEDEERVVWSGREWFCQANLIALLARFGASGRWSWILPDDDPARPGCSAGRLADDALAAAFAARRPILPGPLALARRAWAAYRAAEPAELVALVEDEAALAGWPGLAEALGVHLAEWPDASGLAASERELLAALVDGAGDVAGLLVAHQRRAARPWLTDALVERVLARLAAGPLPLVSGGAVTPAGHDVLAGKARWRTPTRWRGGVEIGSAPAWSWDGARLTPPPA
jgi:hypothetical protein